MPIPVWSSLDALASRYRLHSSSSKATQSLTDSIQRPRHTAIVPPPTSPSTFASSSYIDSDLTTADQLVLRNLFRDVTSQASSLKDSGKKLEVTDCDHQTADELSALSDPTNRQSEPAAFTTWDSADFPPWIRTYMLQPYVAWACGVVRRPSDVVFLTYIIALLALGVPNMVCLFLHFNWWQVLFQWIFVAYFVGPYSFLMHNDIHGR